jgi:hypothetical protein
MDKRWNAGWIMDARFEGFVPINVFHKQQHSPNRFTASSRSQKSPHPYSRHVSENLNHVDFPAAIQFLKATRRFLSSNPENLFEKLPADAWIFE